MTLTLCKKCQEEGKPKWVDADIFDMHMVSEHGETIEQKALRAITKAREQVEYVYAKR